MGLDKQPTMQDYKIQNSKRFGGGKEDDLSESLDSPLLAIKHKNPFDSSSSSFGDKSKKDKDKNLKVTKLGSMDSG